MTDSFTRGPARRPLPAASSPSPIRTAEEARIRFWNRYGWALVQALLLDQAPNVQPQTIDGWITLAEQVRDALHANPNDRLALVLEAAARELRQH